MIWCVSFRGQLLIPVYLSVLPWFWLLFPVTVVEWNWCYPQCYPMLTGHGNQQVSMHRNPALKSDVVIFCSCPEGKMHCAATEQSSECPLYRQAVFFLLGHLAQDTKVPPRCLSWLSSVSVEHFANASWEVRHPCKQYCKPQFQNREMPPCPHRWNSTDAEFCSFLMSHGIKAVVWTLRKSLFPTKTLKQSYKGSKAASSVLKRTPGRGRDVQKWMRRFGLTGLFFSRKISRMLFIAVCCWNTNICSIFKTKKCWFDENQQKRVQEATDVKIFPIMPRQHFLSSFFL